MISTPQLFVNKAIFEFDLLKSTLINSSPSFNLIAAISCFDAIYSSILEILIIPSFVINTNSSFLLPSSKSITDTTLSSSLTPLQ